MIRDIEHKISNCQVIDISKIPNNGKVIFGSYVTLEKEGADSITYQIVGEDESDLEQNRISITSPISRAIISKEEGDSVEVRTPNGMVEYEIIKVSYAVEEQN